MWQLVGVIVAVLAVIVLAESTQNQSLHMSSPARDKRLCKFQNQSSFIDNHLGTLFRYLNNN